MKPETKPSLSARISFWLHRLREIVASVLDSLPSLFSKLAAPFKEFADLIYPHDHTQNKAGRCPKQPPIITNVVPTPPCDEKADKCRYPKTPWWKTAAELIGIAAVVFYTCYAHGQWHEMIRAANAAKESADTAANQFEFVERPQLSGDKMFLVGPVVIDRNGIRLNFRITFTNKGLTRAVKAFAQAEVFPLQISGPEPATVRERVCKQAEEIANTHPEITQPVYPGQQQEIGFSLPINRREMDEAVQRTGYIVPTIVACIAYRPFFNKTSVYHTGFAEVLTYVKRRVIAPQDGTIPLDILDLHETGVTPEISPD